MSQLASPVTPDDGIDRRGFLKCMAWAGTGVLWAVNGGVLTSTRIIPGAGLAPTTLKADLFFAQISDSHIGFSKEANPDVTATLQEAIARVNALERRPAFILHTGDITQLSKPGEFDTARQVIGGARTGKVFYVPGEHDVLGDNGRSYLERYGKGTRGDGWHSFDHSGVHFVGLVNVLNLKPGGLGSLGPAQLEWLGKDLRGLPDSTPIVVFAHVPLWSVYPEWGWGTDDSEAALSLLRRFGSVTVLNGHIHQTLQKVEGNVTFHTAMSTAFPQPAPGTAPSPGPMKVEATRLRSVLGISSVLYRPHGHPLAIVDAALTGAVVTPGGSWSQSMAQGQATTADTGNRATMARPGEIRIDNFSFTPPETAIPAGASVTWINGDDVPHRIASPDGRFAGSPVLDTRDRYTLTFKQPGRYPYYCSIHPKMTGFIVVQ